MSKYNIKHDNIDTKNRRNKHEEGKVKCQRRAKDTEREINLQTEE